MRKKKAQAPKPVTGNMEVRYKTGDEILEELSKELKKPRVGTNKKNHGVKGYPSVNPNLVKYRKSLTRKQIKDIKKGKTKDHSYAIGNISWINKLGSASKAENTLTETTESKVVGLIYNPLDDETFQRLEDAYINDGELQQSIAKYWGLVMGNNLTYSLISCKDDYADDESKNLESQRILNYRPYIYARDKLKRICKKSKFKETWDMLLNLGSIYGRGAAEIIRDTETNDPVFFNILYSQLLGDPVLNKYHQMIGVEYEDLPDDDKFKEMKGAINPEHQAAFPMNKLLYYAHNDKPVTIGARYFGISTLESCIDASETKRIILQKELKEWVSKSHTGNIILTTDEPLPQDELDAIAADVANNPGNVTVLNYKMMAQAVSTPTNVDQLQFIIDALNREMLRYIDIIGPLAGYENIQNYASIAKLVVVWLASTLNPMRLKQKNIIKEQFIDEVFQTCLLQQNHLVLEDPNTLELKLYKVNYPGAKEIPDQDKPMNPEMDKKIDDKNDEDNSNKLFQRNPYSKGAMNAQEATVQLKDNINVKPGDPITTDMTVEPGGMSVREAYETIKKALDKNPDFTLIEGFTFTETGIPAAEIAIDIDLPNFDSFPEILDKVLSAVRERMMTKRKGLSMLGQEDQIDDIKRLDAEAEEKRQQMFDQGIMTDESGKPIPNFRNSNVQDDILIKNKDPSKRTRKENESLNKKELKKDKQMNIMEARG